MPPFRHLRASLALAGAVALGACVNVPELGERMPPGLSSAPFPELIPLDASLTAPQNPAEDAAKLEQSLNGRVAALRAKARRLNEPVIDAPSGARLQSQPGG